MKNTVKIDTKEGCEWYLSDGKTEELIKWLDGNGSGSVEEKTEDD